jgi:hypothetical protein
MVLDRLLEVGGTMAYAVELGRAQPVTTALDTIGSREQSKAAYAALLALLDGLGHYDVENKRTSLHVTRGRAFLGVHPRTNGLLINIVTTAPLLSPRVRRSEQVSARRCHNEVLLCSADEFDAELTGWIKQAYELTAS